MYSGLNCSFVAKYYTAELCNRSRFISLHIKVCINPTAGILAEVCFDADTENCTWRYIIGVCSKSCDGGERIITTEIVSPAKGGGYCPVLDNEMIVEPCNTEPCGECCNS